MNAYLPPDDVRFADTYNRATFLFRHALHELPQFDPRDLVALASRLRSVYYDVGDRGVGAGWSGEPTGLRSLRETMETIADGNALVIMKGLEDDPEFGPIFRETVNELTARIGPSLTEDLRRSRATLIVSSPHRVTPYHVDAETNYLLQLRGTKELSVFDHADRTLLTETELEEFYAGNLNAARYRSERQAEATVFAFGPGDGAHIPLHAPHWVRNGPEVSVAMSVNFSLHSAQRQSHVYAFNHVMRRTGFSPAPPGLIGWSDLLKVVAVGGLRYVRARRRGAYGAARE